VKARSTTISHATCRRRRRPVVPSAVESSVHESARFTRPNEPGSERLFESIPGLCHILRPDLTIADASDAHLRATLIPGSVPASAVYDVFHRLDCIESPKTQALWAGDPPFCFALAAPPKCGTVSIHVSTR
jgi:hypothetical protein